MLTLFNLRFTAAFHTCVVKQLPCSEKTACQLGIHLNTGLVHQPLFTVVQGRMCLQSEKPE